MGLETAPGMVCLRITPLRRETMRDINDPIDSQEIELTDDILCRIVQDFSESQQKLKAQMEHAKEIGGKNPRFSHYTLSETTLKNFAKNYAA
jgi:hypothetical protein